jgi:hypothetical protein
LRRYLPDMSQARAVFVHGNPETAAIWGPLLAEMQSGPVSSVVEDGRHAAADTRRDLA